MAYVRNRNHRCRLIVDSCCDVPREILLAAGVEILEFPYTVGYDQYTDDMWKTFTPKAFYDRMRQDEQPSTMQIPLARYTELFEQVAKDGTPTVILSFTAALSGTFNTAQMVLDQVKAEHPDAEIHLVDTLLASIAEGLLVLGAIRQLDRGLTASELASWACEARYYVHGYFTLDSLEWLKRGGRIPPLLAVVGSKLDIKPLLTFDLDGNLIKQGMTRGRRKALKQLEELFKERSVDASQSVVVIGTADAEKDGDFVEERLGKHVKLHHVVRSSIGPVIGTHVGPGMVAVAFWGQDRRKDIIVEDRIADSVRAGRVETASRFARDAGGVDE